MGKGGSGKGSASASYVSTHDIVGIVGHLPHHHRRFQEDGSRCHPIISYFNDLTLISVLS